MPALVGQSYQDAITLRDATGALVSNAVWTQTYARRQDTTSIVVTIGPETAVGSGVYPVAFPVATPIAHHLWLTAEVEATGFRQHWTATIHPVTTAVPVEVVTRTEWEDLIVLVDALGTPIGGALFALVTGSMIAPAGDPFLPVVVALPITGGYLVRATPVEPGYRRTELITTNVTPMQRVVVACEAFPAGLVLSTGPAVVSGAVTWLSSSLHVASVQWTAPPSGTVSWV